MVLARSPDMGIFLLIFAILVLPMAYRRRRKKKESWFSAPLNPEIKRGVLAVFLFILAILAGLSFFGLAGLLGKFVNDLFSIAFGVAKYAMPILLILWAILIERDEDYEYKPTHVIGVVLTTLCVTGLIHLLEITLLKPP